MKRKLLYLLPLLFVSLSFAQQGINYKALIKDGSGNIVANQNITIQFLILKGAGMSLQYQETHSSMTDVNGIVIVNIGKGTPNSGIFGTIDWGNDDYYLNVKINTGSGLTDMGTTQFMAVPYALYATNIASNGLKVNTLADGKSDANGSSLFLGKDAGLADDGTDNANLGVGFEALKSNSSGYDNTATGYQALRSNTTGFDNSAVGIGSLYSNTTGAENTANGAWALYANTTGNDNTANGYSALSSNTTGSRNTANGASALNKNTTGQYNTANGYLALLNSTTANYNTALGSQALYQNTTGSSNTANGYLALYKNTLGNDNTASGRNALYSNTSGNANTANGYLALYNNTSGNFNTAYGRSSLEFYTIGNFNTAVGYNALNSMTTGTYNTAIGIDALRFITSGSNNIGVGNYAQVPNAEGSNQIRMGGANISYAGIQVAWTVTSDISWKKDIRELPFGLNMISKLRPVDYIRKNNENETREMGFIAQDVELTLKELGYDDQGFLTKDDEGRMSLRYNDFIALLTKGMQEQQQIIERQKEQIEGQQKEIESLKSDQSKLDKRLKTLETFLN